MVTLEVQVAHSTLLVYAPSAGLEPATSWLLRGLTASAHIGQLLYHAELSSTASIYDGSRRRRLKRLRG